MTPLEISFVAALGTSIGYIIGKFVNDMKRNKQEEGE